MKNEKNKTKNKTNFILTKKYNIQNSSYKKPLKP